MASLIARKQQQKLADDLVKLTNCKFRWQAHAHWFQNHSL